MISSNTPISLILVGHMWQDFSVKIYGVERALCGQMMMMMQFSLLIPNFHSCVSFAVSDFTLHFNVLVI